MYLKGITSHISRIDSYEMKKDGDFAGCGSENEMTSCGTGVGHEDGGQGETVSTLIRVA